MKIMSIVVMLTVAAAHQAAAQVFTTPKGGAENVTFEQVGGGIVNITYDLVSSDPRAIFAVTLDASQDRGATFTVRPSSVSGDVGPGVKPGTGKRIVWESGRDVERLEIDQFRFRISAQAGPLELKADPPPAPAPAPAAMPSTPEKPPAAPVSQPQTAADKPKSGGGAKWLLIGGGAAAAAGVAAASGGSGGGSTATSSTPPATTTPPVANRAPVISSATHNSPAVALVLVTDVTFAVEATDPDGNALVALWQYGDGSTATAPLTNGRATTEKSFATSGTQLVQVTVGDNREGKVSTTYPQVVSNTITGLYIGTTASGSTVRLNLVQNGIAVNAEYVDGQGRSASATSTLRAPRAMSLTLSYRGGTGGSETYAMVFSNDLRSVSAASGGTTLTLTRQ